MRNSWTLLSGIIAVIVVLSIVHVAMANRIATTGIVLGRMQEDIKRYQKENTLIEEKILELSSLTQIASKAATLGFVPATKEISISGPQPLALKQ